MVPLRASAGSGLGVLASGGVARANCGAGNGASATVAASAFEWGVAITTDLGEESDQVDAALCWRPP